MAHLTVFAIAMVVATVVWGLAGLVIALSLSGVIGIPTWSVVAREPLDVADWLLELLVVFAAIGGVYLAG